uniref:uncharacterized protein LOC120333739 n=1 Tax=Styela clava TaxID=7725 RepID=UPI00193AE009|nr:uncharacterized protein LOC120333739 [Styela clava]
MPQNTVPMAKYRKKIYEGLPDSDNEDGVLTDAQQWNKSKLLENKGKVRSNFHADSDQPVVRRRRKSLWATPDELSEAPPKTLEEEIYKPTYIVGANMSEENLFTALTKGQPRRKSLAFIGNVVSKLTKRKNSAYQDESDDENAISEADGVSEPTLPRNPTVVTFAEPDADEFKFTTVEDTGRPSPTLSYSNVGISFSASLSSDKLVSANYDNLEEDRVVHAPIAPPPPMAFMDTNSMISFSELLVAQAASDHRDPENLPDIPPPLDYDVTLTTFPLDTIPEIDNFSSLSDVPVFIRPPESIFEKNDDLTSEDNGSNDDKPRRVRRRTSRKQHRALRGNSMRSDGDYYDDTERENRVRRRKSTRRHHSSRSIARSEEENDHGVRRRSTHRSRRRESTRGDRIGHRVGVEQLDRTRRLKSDDAMENPLNAFSKLASYVEAEMKKVLTSNEHESPDHGNSDKNENPVESFAQKLVALVENRNKSKPVNSDHENNSPGTDNSRPAAEDNTTEPVVTSNSIDNKKATVNDRNIKVNKQHISSAKYYVGETEILVNNSQHETVPTPVYTEILSSQRNATSKHSARDVLSRISEDLRTEKSRSEVTNEAVITQNSDIIPADNDLNYTNKSIVSSNENGSDQAITNKTVIRLPGIQSKPDETAEGLVKRVESFLNGASEEGEAQFQRVPGRQWVVEWARWEGVTQQNGTKIKRKKSEKVARKSSVKSTASTSSIGSFFGRFFSRFKPREEVPIKKEMEVIACVYMVNTSQSGPVGDEIQNDINDLPGMSNFVSRNDNRGIVSSSNHPLVIQTAGKDSPTDLRQKLSGKNGRNFYESESEFSTGFVAHNIGKPGLNKAYLYQGTSKDSGMYDGPSSDSLDENKIINRRRRPSWAN